MRKRQNKLQDKSGWKYRPPRRQRYRNTLVKPSLQGVLSRRQHKHNKKRNFGSLLNGSYERFLAAAITFNRNRFSRNSIYMKYSFYSFYNCRSLQQRTLFGSFGWMRSCSSTSWFPIMTIDQWALMTVDWHFNRSQQKALLWKLLQNCKNQTQNGH